MLVTAFKEIQEMKEKQYFAHMTTATIPQRELHVA